MFGEIELPTFEIEAVLQDYLLRAKLRPRGPIIQYLNDHNWSFIPILDAELQPLEPDRRVGMMKQAKSVINKRAIEVVSLLDAEQASEIILPASKRPMIFHIRRFVIRGQLHVPADAPDEDALDDLHDFFPVSDSEIVPIRSVAATPTQNVPLLLISRLLVQSYYART